MTRVLVVDDREENLYFVEALLRGNGFAVERAPHGEEALRMARKTLPDIVVSDLLMPVMDGYTLLRHWKADPDLNGVPFVVYTATYTEAQDEELALSLGADAFIVKPAEPDVLLARIRDVHEQARTTPASAPRVPTGDEESRLEAYNQVLVRKLEQKMLQLEAANRQLHSDLEERTRAKEALERSSALLRIAGRAAHLGGWSLRLGEPTVMWSDETCAIHDVSAGHRPTLEEAAAFAVPDHRTGLRAAFEACIRTGEAFDVEVAILTAQGRKVWIRAIGEPVRDAAGAVVGLQGAVQDISERRDLEQRLLRSQRMESIASLTSGMAHDLNNVLAPILLSLELLRDEEVGEEVRESLETIEACATRGSEMVRQVLSFARGVEEPRGRVDVHRVVEDAAKIVRDTFPGSVEFTSSLLEDLWPVDGDPTQIHQVLMNSLINARDAMPGGGALTMTVDQVRIDEHYAAMSGNAEPGRYVRISVTDSGTGMPADVLPHIFDPLYTTKEAGTGTGLGLSTVATVMRGHGGFVSVYTEVGRGSTFRFHFPVAHGDGSLVEAARSRAELEGHGERLLVVDDEASVRSITQHTLEAFGYAVLTAETGDEALAWVRTRAGDIDLVVTDLAMPNMDGAALVRALREVAPGLPVVAVSGMGGTPEDERVAGLGADGYLSKPYTAEELLTVIGGLLGER